jgi:hypothetical protein
MNPTDVLGWVSVISLSLFILGLPLALTVEFIVFTAKNFREIKQRKTTP